MSRIVRFEIHASKPEALIEFYSAVLGWKFSEVPARGYWRIDTGSAAEAGLVGGLVQRTGPAPGDSPTVNAFICMVEVASLDATLAQAVSLGAAITLPKMPVPGVGWLAYIRDPDGNLLSLLQIDGKPV
jgi:predicted enzyme related to lactoylglutathione lyase